MKEDIEDVSVAMVCGVAVGLLIIVVIGVGVVILTVNSQLNAMMPIH